jgi:hypothetical protein
MGRYCPSALYDLKQALSTLSHTPEQRLDAYRSVVEHLLSRLAERPNNSTVRTLELDRAEREAIESH